MITGTSESPRYCTRFSDGRHEAIADVPLDKGGSGSGFRPHELLEAALATCVNMNVRMFAENHRIPLERVTTKVQLDRSVADETTFCY
jgi:putative redox protein